MGFPLPACWLDRFAGYDIAPISAGHSAAGLLRLTAPGKPGLLLKREARGPFAELPDEIEKLRWLAAQDIPAPAVVATADEGAFHYLLMSALPGEDLSAALLPPDTKVEIAATALRRLHAVPVSACPFDTAIATVIERAAARLEAGLVDEADFDAENRGRSGADLLVTLKAKRPRQADLVVAHGDATLANLIADGPHFAGFVDCGRLGVADRYQDLAIAARDIAGELGERYLPPFFKAYGIAAIDLARLSYYRIVDEFF